MSARLSGTTIQDIQTLFQHGAMGSWSDGQLVTEFHSGQQGSEAAFRILLHRHGPMVMGICRRILDDPHAAEDAFQATFLVLVRKAGSLRNADLLTGWLYGVAQRIAKKSKVAAARRQSVEQRAEQPMRKLGRDAEQAELLAVIDEEIRRLPERYRVPLVLCYLEGMQHQEAARRLGCPVGTIESRLSRARDRLRSRLVQRGLAPTAMTAVLAPTDLSAALAPLIEATIRAASRPSSRRTLIGVISRLSWSKGLLHAAPIAHAGAVIPALAVCIGMFALGFNVFRAQETKVSELAAFEVDSRPTARAVNPVVPRSATVQEPRPGGRPRPTAFAPPITGVTIDGRLDDWPTSLPRHPIRTQFLRDPYDRNQEHTVHHQDAYFMVGHDPSTELIYLAVVVRDEDLVADPRDPLHTDAVEVYVNGIAPDRADPGTELNSWPSHPDASRFPVVQYAAVPGPVAAYADPARANPSLVYGKISDSATTMRYRRTGDVTTYEWEVQPFDQYPDKVTRLVPGKRIGFDVAVVDKDNDRDSPIWFSWGPHHRIFKGFEPSNLGELVIGEPPS